MAKFRVSKKDKETFNRMKKRARSKLKRIKDRDNVDLTADIPLPRNINSFKTRKEFNEWKDTIDFFTIRNNSHFTFKTNKYGVTASVYEISETERKTKIAQNIARNQVKEIENKAFYLNEEKQPATVGQMMLQMGKPNAGGVVIPQDFDFENFKTRKGFNERKNSMETRSDPKHFEKRKEDMQKNFVALIHEAYGADGDELVDLLEEMPAEHFYRIYVQTSEFDFNLYYGLDGMIDAPEEAPLNRMVSYVKRYREGGYDTDLDNF